MRASSWLIILCLLTSFIVFLNPSLVKLLVFTSSDLYNLRLWTLITAIFVHADILHLVGNMLFLFVLGRTLEEEFGAKRFLIIFFTGGILSFILSIPFYGSVGMLGASAAIFSVAAAAMLARPLKFSILFLAPVGVVALFYFIYNVAMVYYGVAGNVGYIAHIIGFFIGVPFGVAWSKKWVRNLAVSILLVIIYIIIIWIIQGLL